MWRVKQQKELLSECMVLLQVACLIRVPSEVVKQRAQVSPSSSTLRILSHTLYHEVGSEQNFREVASLFSPSAMHVQKHSYKYIPVLCSPSTFPSILLLFKAIDVLCLRKPNPYLPHAHAHTKQLLFFPPLFLWGTYIKKKKKKQKQKQKKTHTTPKTPQNGIYFSSFPSSACIYANNPCLGQENIESLCLEFAEWLLLFEAAFRGGVLKVPFQRGSVGALEISVHPVLVTSDKWGLLSSFQ